MSAVRRGRSQGREGTGHRTAVVLTAALLAAVAGALAQGNPRLQEVDVALWPEYDRPSVLVMYRIGLAPDTAVPTTLRLRIPAAVGAPTAVAEAQPGGNLVNASYERRVEGDWAVLTIEVTRPRVQVEYYDTRLQRQGARRSFEYAWPGMAAAEAVELTVQEPVGARDLSIEPAPDRRGEAADGLVYHSLAVVDPAEPLTLRLEYTKDTDALSVESMAPAPPVNPTAPDATSAAPAAGGDEVPVWVLALVGLGAVAGGLAWWLLSRRDALTTRGSPGGDGGSTAGAGGPAFCTQCGGKVRPQDKFCASCGRKLGG